MLAAASISDLNSPILWGPEDVVFLEELAHLGMDLVRGLCREVADHSEVLDRGETPPLSPDQCCRISRRFVRISRGIRLTLILKARIRRGDPPPGDPIRVRDILRSYILGDAEPTPAAERTLASVEEPITQVRAEQEPLETERLTERLIERIEREVSEPLDRERFTNLPLAETVAQICKDFGLTGAWQALRTDNGETQAWVLTLPGEAPILWPHKDHPCGENFGDSALNALPLHRRQISPTTLSALSPKLPRGPP